MEPTPLSLPAATDPWGDWLRDRVREGLGRAGEVVATLREASDGHAAILQLWNDAGIEVANVLAVTSLAAAVHPDEEVRSTAEELEAEARRFLTDLTLDASVFARLESVRPDPLDDGARRVLADALREFRRSGVDRDEDVRDRVRELRDRETALGQAFARNIREGRRTTKVPVSALAGLPADFIADHPAVDGEVEISTDYTETHPFLTFSTDAEARRAVGATFFDLGWPANDQVLADLLAVRHERATLLGYPDWPSYDAEVKMIGSGPAIAEFIDRISAEADEAGRSEVAELAEAVGETVDVVSWRHALEELKRERFGVSANEVRSYLDFTKVRDGLLAVTGRLFGVEYQPVATPSWHPDVTAYDVLLDGDLLGRIHLDLHPRAGKYNHAAQFDLRPGVRGRQLPEGVLVCNFPRGLMEHRDVVTLFHEFGHLLHHVLAGRHEWVRFSGVATEWDFVEAPSQMLEEWAWDTEVLRSFATNADGDPIPAALVERMRAAEEFGKGFLARTQMFYAAVSYRFHQERPADLTARLFELYDEYSLLPPLPGTHFHAGFGHLEGYSSAYYTYMWSKTIAKDMFTAFDPDDLFAPEVAIRYRDRVLAPGGSRDAAALVADFLGRPYDTRAFTAWLTS
ncbi:M3 family metallopeptidase [Nocardioides terrisoli]|uniref:M3 family metallopeptidase n=1 Tax=Nocardioides terrisoli TaxID=3388267 RepID=UPI00287B8DCD|nr:M3 family metallopeptidase [Nocardioides marmorisolisilvae]